MSGSDPVLGLRALADSTRLAVVRLLVEGAFNVGEIQEILSLGQSTASHHLKILTDAELLVCRREGRLAYYQWETSLPPSLDALRAFVTDHAPPLDSQARQRLHGVFESRAERTRRYFDGPSAEALASERSSVTGVDIVVPLAAQVPEHGTVVDLGTGAGRLLGTLRGRGARVIGIDASPRMLERAGKLAHERGWTEIDLRLGTLEHLPLRDGEADAAVAHLVMHHAAQPEIALAEAYRVLRPSGRLVIGDFLPHDQEWMREELADQWLGFEPAAFEGMLRKAGFEEIKTERYPSARVGELGMFIAVAQRSSETQTKKLPRTSSRKDCGGR